MKSFFCQKISVSLKSSLIYWLTLVLCELIFVQISGDDMLHEKFDIKPHNLDTDIWRHQKVRLSISFSSINIINISMSLVKRGQPNL